MRPHLEYANSVWNPYKCKDTESFENVQRRATKMLPHLSEKSYQERLEILKLPTLKFRRLRGDMIEAYTIIAGIYDKRTTKGMFILNTSNTRGHNMKVAKQKCKLDVRKYFFTNRVADTWNSLPEHVVSATKVKTFENRLDRYWKNHPMKYEYIVDYGTFKGNDQAITQSDDHETIEMNIEEQQFLRS